MSILVRHERKGSVFEIILDRPEKRNAIDLEMYEQFAWALTEAGQSDGLRVLLIRGEGKAFSAGIDVMAFMQLPQNYGSGWV